MSTIASHASPESRKRSFVDPTAIMQIKNLSLRAKSIVDGFHSGIHRSALRGFSVEFAEYRPYVLGDDPRNLDWKLLARSDRYYIKQYEDETNRRCYLALDASRSMGYGSGSYSKYDYARTLAATLAYYLNLQRDAVGVMRCGGDIGDVIPPRHRPGHLQQLMHMLGKPSDCDDFDLGASLSSLAGISKRRGMVIVLSDLLVEPESLMQALGYLRGRHHEVLLLRVLDRAEIDLSLPDSTMLHDLETGREIYIDPAQARKQYRQRFSDHEQQLIDLCHRRSARLITVASDEPFEIGLLEILNRTGSRLAAAVSKEAASKASLPNSQRSVEEA
jgi:uncharacterized protein (DUF58 family)